MKTADVQMPAAQESIVVGLFRIAYQRFSQPAQLLLVTMAQLAIEPNQAALDMRKFIPRWCGHLNIPNTSVFAIQHVYYSIKCIPKAPLWGQVRILTRTLCLIRPFGSLVSHGLHKTPNGPLIICRDAPVLLNNAVLCLAQCVQLQRATPSIDDVKHIKTERACGKTQIGRCRVAGTGLVISLSSFRDTKLFRKLILRQPSLGSLLAQPCANLFRECQYFSIRIFTLAVFCHILRLSSHENARNCTMPNSTITEQARQQARASLEKRGQTAKNFAALHNLNPSTVYAVLNGQSQCRRGEAHRAAVLLGIKDGVIAQ